MVNPYQTKHIGDVLIKQAFAAYDPRAVSRLGRRFVTLPCHSKPDNLLVIFGYCRFPVINHPQYTQYTRVVELKTSCNLLSYPKHIDQQDYLTLLNWQSRNKR